MLGYLSQQSRRTLADWQPQVVLENVSRRSVLLGFAAGGLALGAYSRPVRAFARYPTGGAEMPHGLTTDPLAFVALASDGTVTIVAHRSEMGQGSKTSLPMILADEMEADWSRVQIVQAPGDEPKYGNQNTDGSRSLRHHIQTMRQMGAAVRHMLAHAAARKWHVDVAAVTVSLHEVIHAPSGRRLGFGDLARAAMMQAVPRFEDLSFKAETAFRYIGKGTVPIADLHGITAGTAFYGADVAVGGMLIAVIARPPVVGGKVKSWDATATLKVPGVVKVLELKGSVPPAKFAPLGGIAVVARHTYAAIAGRRALTIEWEDGPHGSYDSAAYQSELEAAARAPGKIVREQGDVAHAFKHASKIAAREYYQPHLVHAPMEPPVALARVTNSKAEIWAPVQSPYDARQDVAALLGMKVADVTVNVTLLGGGFGRKSKCDYVLEAALLSKAMRAPVRVQWTREDDIRHSFYHPPSLERIEAALDGKGKVTGWLHRSVAPTIMSTFMPDSGFQSPIENGMGLVDLPFHINNIRCENARAMARTRIGWFRSVYNIQRAFAVQSFVSELAAELGRDHKALLLELIGPARTIAAAELPEDWWNYGEPKGSNLIDTGRLIRVLNLAADQAGWGRPLPRGEGIGLAVHRSFLAYVAVAVRVRIVGGRIRVPEAHIGLDCGFVANPERVRSQMEGCAVMGMTLALYGGITYKNGRVNESNFFDYRMVVSENFPEKVHTHIVDHPFAIAAAGAGEPGLPPIAPAIANAVFNATGTRLRQLPMGERVDL